MAARQISNEQRKWLESELADWRGSGTITDAQADQILAGYETSHETQRRQGSIFAFVMSGIAALMIGLALLLLIGYNWDGMPRELKLVIVFGTILATQTAGWYLKFRRDARLAGEILSFLGCLFYGAGIWLVAQVFHLDSHYPDGVLWWAIGVLPFALLLDTLLVQFLFVALLALWAGMEVLGFANLGHFLFGRHWMIPNGAYALPLLAAPGVIWAYRKGSPTAVGLYAMLGAWWGTLQMIAWHLEFESFYFIGSLGAIYLIIAESHRQGSRMAIPFRTFGALLLAGALIPASFVDFHKHFNSTERQVFASAVQLIAIAVLLIATVLISAWLRPRTVGESSKSLWENVQALVSRQWLPVGMAVTMGAMSFLSSNVVSDSNNVAVVLAVVANVAIVCLSLWLIRVGLNEERGRPFFAGIVYFLLWAMLRYFDLFGDVGGMLGAAGMFFLCGLALFGVGWFWRSRKEVRHV